MQKSMHSWESPKLKTLICHLMHEFVRPQTTDVHQSVMYNNLGLISSINYSDHYF